MAHILIATHDRDEFRHNHFVLNRYLAFWKDEGIKVQIVAGLGPWPEADAVFLHVDLSVVPSEFIERASRYRVAINGTVRDIRKSAFSRNLVRPGDDWAGPVIVKTDLNYCGIPEQRIEGGVWTGRIREGLGRIRKAVPFLRWLSRGPRRYPIYPSVANVPEEVWAVPSLIVEKFLPEPDPKGFAVRCWVFLGDRESCSRMVGAHPVVKAGDASEYFPCDVPEEIRAERDRLGFDFGKFDFVIHDGRPVLLDVNKTPGAPPPSMNSALAINYRDTAAGLGSLLRRVR